MLVYGKYECIVMQMLYVCVLCAVHHVAVLNAALCMTCSLLMLVEDARGDHMEEAYSRAGLMNALYVAISVSFCLPHPVAVNVFIICSGLYAFLGFTRACVCRCDGDVICVCHDLNR